MKKILLLLVALPFIVHAQFFPTDKSQLGGGLGMVWIDNMPHYSIRVNPDLTLGKWGVGLDLNLEFTSEGKLRTESFKDFSDYLAVIRYIRYGQKNDPFYAQFGSVDFYTLGFGGLMYGYSNSPSFDKRKTGLVLDADFEKFGFESIYSDFSQGGVFGLRGFVRPLHFSDLKSLPLIGDMEVGVSYASDFNKNAHILGGGFDVAGNFVSTDDKGSFSGIGFDIGIPLVQQEMLNVTLYTEYSKLMDYGSGMSTGLLVEFGLGPIVKGQAKFERRFNNDEYLPSYFDALYEVQRFSTNGLGFASKAAGLKGLKTDDNGFFGSLKLQVMGMFQVVGSYSRFDKTPSSGILQLRSDVTPEDAPVVVRAGYDKVNIANDVDMFTLDDRSHMYVEAGYKPMPYMLVTLGYHWTFSPIRSANDDIVGYEPQKRLEPRVEFIMPLNFGGN